MKFMLSSVGLLQALAILFISPCCKAATPTSASATATATGKSKLDLEDQRAECYIDCYGQYGNFTNCEFGQLKLLECWCSEADWIEREEDCVWDVCGVDAYNEYAPIYERRCQTVQVPSGRPPTWTYTTESKSTSTSVPTTTSFSQESTNQLTKTSPVADAQSEGSTTTSQSASVASEITTATNKDTSGATKLAWNSGAITGFVMILFIL